MAWNKMGKHMTRPHDFAHHADGKSAAADGGVAYPNRGKAFVNFLSMVANTFRHLVIIPAGFPSFFQYTGFIFGYPFSKVY